MRRRKQNPNHSTFEITESAVDKSPSDTRRDSTYFDKPEDLRQKSNSKIGQGLYSKRKDTYHRTNLSTGTGQLNSVTDGRRLQLGRKTITTNQK